MAREGLRVLVVSKKSLTEEQYQDFEVRWRLSCCVLADRHTTACSVLWNVRVCSITESYPCTQTSHTQQQAPPIVWGLGRLPTVFPSRPITEVYNCVSRAGGHQWVTAWVAHRICVFAWLIFKIVLALSHLKIALQPWPWRSAPKSVLYFQLSGAWKL